MNRVRSADGTAIAFERTGDGPPLILVNGALSDRGSGAPLVRALEPDRSVIVFDRRGRGASGDTEPYAVAREIEDLAALLERIGEPTAVFGHSSGGTLTLRAAMAGVPMSHVVVYEPPFLVDDQRSAPPPDLAERLGSLVARGDRDAALRAFLRDGVGVPEEAIDATARTPAWPDMLAMAHTTAYDAAITGTIALPREELGALATPVLVLQGGESPGWMRAGTEALAVALPNGELRIVEGQSHAGPVTVPDLVGAEVLGFLRR